MLHQVQEEESKKAPRTEKSRCSCSTHGEGDGDVQPGSFRGVHYGLTRPNEPTKNVTAPTARTAKLLAKDVTTS